MPATNNSSLVTLKKSIWESLLPIAFFMVCQVSLSKEKEETGDILTTKIGWPKKLNIPNEQEVAYRDLHPLCPLTSLSLSPGGRREWWLVRRDQDRIRLGREVEV